MEDLLIKWSELKKQPLARFAPVGSIHQRATDELIILEALLSAGCTQIPGEPFDVGFMITDRRRLLGRMRDADSNI
jgi:hypothetical protein